MTNLSGANLNNGAAVGPQGEGRDSPSTFPKYPAYKDSGVEWLGEVPEHWVVTRLGRVTEIESGYPFPAEQFVDDGIPVVRMSDLKEGQVSLDSIKRVEARFVPVKAMAKADDLLIGLSGSISNFAQVSASDLPLAVNQRVGIIRADDSIEATIAKYFVISKSFICQIESAVPETTILNISMEQVRSCALAWPPRFEQIQITRFLDHETGKIDGLIAEQEKLIELLKEKRQATISHAVTKGLNPDVPMKDSGVEWLGEVPEHWCVGVQKHGIAFIESGTSVNAADYPASNEELGVLKTSCVYTGSFDWHENKTVNEEDLQRVTCPLAVGTLIVSRMNTPELVGAAGFVKEAPQNIFLPDRLWQVHFDENYSTEFMYWFSLSRAYREQIKIACSGTSSSMQNLAQDDFKNIKISFPPRDEQNQIVKYLDRETAKLDTLLTEAQRGIELLKERRSALISAAVTGKIDVRNWKPQGDAA